MMFRAEPEDVAVIRVGFVEVGPGLGFVGFFEEAVQGAQGGAFDFGAGLDLDKAGSVYVVGRTSSGFPTTAGAVQPCFGGGFGDFLVTKIKFEPVLFFELDKVIT